MALAMCILCLAFASTAQAAPPGADAGAGDQQAPAPAGGGKPKQPEQDCAGGIPGIEQLCDGVDAVGGAASGVVDTVTGAPGAIVKYSNGIVDFISEHCIGCGNCVTGCPFDVPRISKTDNKAYKCSLCSDRVVVGLEPACVKACPTGAIRFGTKEDMHDFAAERLVDLKERGYPNAGVYDPQGVGGTHVMYVLQHADRPEIYHGLPKDPRPDRGRRRAARERSRRRRRP